MPDYEALARFLIEPLISDPHSLIVDCEITCQGKRIWLRIQFKDTDKGRVFGRGGRTLQAIRQVLHVSALLAEHNLSIDLYDQSFDPNPPEPKFLRSKRS